MKPAHLGLGLFLIAHTMLFAALASSWLFLVQSDPSFHGFMAMLAEFVPLAATLYWPTTLIILVAGGAAVLAARTERTPIALLALALLFHGCVVGFLTVQSLAQASAPATANLIALFTVVEALWLVHAVMGLVLLGWALRRPPLSMASAVFIVFTAAGWAIFRVGFALT